MTRRTPLKPPGTPPDLHEFERTVDVVQEAADEGVDLGHILTVKDTDFLESMPEQELSEAQLEWLQGIRNKVNGERR